MTDQELFQKIYTQLLYEGIHEEALIENIVKYIIENPDLYPEYF